MISNHFLRKYEEIHNCVITNADIFNDRAQQYKKQFKTYQNQEKFRIHCSKWMNLPALNKPPSCVPLLSSSQIRLYFSTETLTNLTSEMVLLLMSKVHTVASREDQRSMLVNLNEDTFRKLFYSLPRPVLSTYSEKLSKVFHSHMILTFLSLIPNSKAFQELLTEQRVKFQRKIFAILLNLLLRQSMSV